jgi:rhodanese-related sulfurtransferase
LQLDCQFKRKETTPLPESLEITPSDAKSRLAAQPKTAVLIDVREPDEVAVARIDGARLIPMQSVPAQLGHLEALADESDLFVICHAGVRSLHVVNWLRNQGVANCFSVAGGIDRWSVEIDPSVPRY